MSYDLIGDIHGHTEPLAELLHKLATRIPMVCIATLDPDDHNRHLRVHYEKNCEQHEAPPVFVGHYWLDTQPSALAPNVACLDYSVAAKSGGKLVAYRWDGERQIDNDKFVFIENGAE